MLQLNALLKRLIEGRIDFVLVGGYAAVAHGGSLMTRDVDICCPFSAETLFRLQEILKDLHPRHRLTPNRIPLALDDELCARLKNLYLETDWGPLDCLGEVAGIGGYEEVSRHAVNLETPAGQCRVLAIDALIRAKEAMNRPHDQITARQLKAIQEKLRGGAA